MRIFDVLGVVSDSLLAIFRTIGVNCRFPYMSQWLSLESKEVIVVPTDTRGDRR